MDPVILTITGVLVAIWCFVGKVLYDQLQRPATQPEAAGPAIAHKPSVTSLRETEHDQESQPGGTDQDVPTWDIE
ncbi:MAG: hypothetical protein O2923_10255 [Verrucomicrobia bacterium]|nr:hypothetical protein [Verrucomicrobiota bacterium]MDA1087655.1 hypothetical protein [Verrucomicrobiota bacterium]